MSSEKKAIPNLEGKTLFRHWNKMELVSYLLVIAAIVAQAVCCWHRHKMASLRERYLEEHGAINIVAAIGFDLEAAVVEIPLLLIWFGLQLASVLVFLFNFRSARYYAVRVFWLLWSIAWGLYFF